MKRIILILALLLITSCTAQNTVQNNPLDVSIQSFNFSPGELTIKVGETVTWTNYDNAQHTVTGNGFSSGTLDVEQSFMHTFTEPGTYKYHCNFHSSMNGKVIVTF